LADNFAAFVMSATRANVVREAHLSAVAALNEVAGLERIVRPTAVTPA
jgi:hypothetical protein